MHFNITNKDTILNKAEKDLFHNYNSNGLFAIDTINIDDHCRFTFTKKLKKIFSVQSGDTIAVYHNRDNEELIFNIQRSDSIVGTWICKKIDDVYQRDYYHLLVKMDNNDLVPKISNEYEKYNNMQEHDIQKNTKRSDKSSLQQEHVSKIMIVDDEEDILLSFETFLKDNNSFTNVTVETFKSSQEALLHFIESHYDLAIIDVKLPGINGIQLFKIMKSIRPDTNMLFISALESAQEFITMLPGIGTSDIIKKPIEMEYFVDKIKYILNSRRIQ
jgi:CheY-like chemotaxis protein